MRAKMKYLLCFVTVLAALYAAWQSAAIAGIGVAEHIAQLEGDGGSGIAAVLLWMVAAALCLVRLSMAIVCYLATSLVFTLAALAFGDSFMWLWALAAVVCALAAYGLRIKFVRVRSLP